MSSAHCSRTTQRPAADEASYAGRRCILAATFRHNVLRLLILPLIFQSTGSAQTISINSVFADQEKILAPNAKGELVIPSGTHELQFDAICKDPMNAQGLKVRLHPDAKASVSPSVSFFLGAMLWDSNNTMVSNHVQRLKGNSQGWSGITETSGFQRYRTQFEVPKRAHMMSLLVCSDNTMPVALGVLVLRTCRITLVPADASNAPQVMELSPGKTSMKWAAQGTQPVTSRVSTYGKDGDSVLLIEDRSMHSWTGMGISRFELGQVRQVVIDWEAAHTVSSAQATHSYRQLKPGSYVLSVEGQSIYGKPSGERIEVPFVVNARFYETLEFRVALVVLGGLVTAFVSRHLTGIRMRQRLAELEKTQAVERERARIARDLHDNLGADLTHLALLSDLTSCNLGNTGETRKRLDQMFELAQSLTRQVDEMVWTVSPEQDTLESLACFLTNHAEVFLGAARIVCRVNISDIDRDLRITSLQRYHILLAAKEALHNIVKHSKASEARIGIRHDERFLTIDFKDNGRGLPEILTAGDGSSNMEQRMTMIGGSLSRQSSSESGTTVTLKIPLSS